MSIHSITHVISKGVNVRAVINLDPVLGLYLGLREGSISDGEVSLESRLLGIGLFVLLGGGERMMGGWMGGWGGKQKYSGE